jgi:hypothetical protein
MIQQEWIGCYLVVEKRTEKSVASAGCPRFLHFAHVELNEVATINR